MNGAKIYFEIPVLGGIPITQTTVSSFVVMLLLCVSGYFLGRNLKKRPGRMQVLTEKMITVMYDMVEETMGKHNSYWTPYIGTLFLSSLGGTLIGMTGILRSATADLSTTVTWALMTSVLVWSASIKTNGFWNWLKGYINPMNIISDVAQPVSMAFRHFGNIMGGGVLMSLLYSALAGASALLIGLVSKSSLAVELVVLAAGAALIVFGVKRKKIVMWVLGAFLALLGFASLLETIGLLVDMPFMELGIPGVLSLYFDIFSGGVQALVFSLLTMVYVGSACPPPEESNS